MACSGMSALHRPSTSLTSSTWISVVFSIQMGWRSSSIQRLYPYKRLYIFPFVTWFVIQNYFGLLYFCFVENQLLDMKRGERIVTFGRKGIDVVYVYGIICRNISQKYVLALKSQYFTFNWKKWYFRDYIRLEKSLWTRMQFSWQSAC